MEGVITRLGMLSAVLLLLPALSTADELRYRPVNPAFGGNPLNSDYLLGTAEGQRPERPTTRRDPLERFAETVQARLLDQVAQRITESILGENAQDSGSFSVGDTQINFNRDAAGQVAIQVRTVDGREVTLQIPVDEFLTAR